MRALIAVLAVVAASAAAVPASAAEELVVVRGTRSGYVDVVLENEFQVDTFASRVHLLTGRVGGFWAERLRQPSGETPDTFGIVRIRHQGETLTARVSRALGKPDETGYYRPGTYRFHVFTDGAFELTVPGQRVDGLVVRPRTFTARPRLTIVEGKPGTGNASWEARERITVGAKRSVAVSMSSVRWNGTGLHQHLLCFATPGGDCAEDKRHVVNGAITAAYGGQHRAVEAYFAPPGLVRQGTWDAYQRSATSPGPNFTAMHGMALVFEAPL